MAISDEKGVAEWVNGRLRELVVPGESKPREDRVRERLHLRGRRRKTRRRVFGVVAACLSAVALLIAFSPSTRLVAERVWQKLRPRGIVLVRQEDYPRDGFLHWEYLPPAEPPRQVDTVEEAAKAAGFVPRLPDWNVVGERPTETRFRVVAAVSARVTIDVNRLRQILREEGKNFNVPQSWDGAEFISETGAAIIAMFDDRLMVAQYPPTEARVPAGFPLAQIRNVRKLLEPGGLSTEQILRLRTGDVLQGIDPDPEIDAHEVKLKSGRGVFVQNNSSHPTHTQTCFFCPVYPHESVIAWIVPDRQFVVRASYATEELLVRVANSIR